MKKIFLLTVLGLTFITQSCIKDNEDPIAIPKSDGAVVSPNVGGASQPNQVWIDLGTEDVAYNKRTDWDFGFYTGTQFKVILNSSIMMAAGKIPNATNIDEVKEADLYDLQEKVVVASFDPANEQFIDDPKGYIVTGRTAISEITANDDSVYLINMGFDIYKGVETPGTAYTGGESRGWKKVQITRVNDGYKIKYANLNEKTHQEYIITKNSDFNFNFFSTISGKEVSAQPEKKKWDIGFTVITNVIAGAGSYIYADFVVTNVLGGASAYQVTVKAPATGQARYDQFKIEDIDVTKFINNDQTVIGANWRNPIGANGLEVYSDRFYVIRDADGYFFKLRFTRMTDPNGNRGFPQFEYKPL
ncbi:HmuY family protein [Chryseobacterium sp. T1]